MADIEAAGAQEAQSVTFALDQEGLERMVAHGVSCIVSADRLQLESFSLDQSGTGSRYRLQKDIESSTREARMVAWVLDAVVQEKPEEGNWLTVMNKRAADALKRVRDEESSTAAGAPAMPSL